MPKCKNCNNLYNLSNKDDVIVGKWCPKINDSPHLDIRYSDAYEVYGLTRTGCCGCPISYKAVDDLELIRPYEPNVVKAAWNIFGKSYEYRKKYNEYKQMRMAQEKETAANVEGQMSMEDFMK